MAHHEIVALDSLGDNRALGCFWIPRGDLFSAVGRAVKQTIRAKPQAVGTTGVLGEQLDFVVSADAINFRCRHVGEKHGAVRHRGQALGPAVAVTEQLPVLARFKEAHRFVAALVVMRLHLGGIAVPKPAHRIGEDGVAVFAAVPAVAPFVFQLIAGKLERALYHLVGDPPVAAVNVQVILTVLQKNAERLRLGFADERRNLVAAAQADVSADGRVNPVKRIGPVPSDVEGADRAGTGTGDASQVRVDAELYAVRPLDVWQQLVDQKLRVAVAHVVVLETSVEAGLGVFVLGRHYAGIDEHADHHRDVAPVDEVVERVEGGAIDISFAVLKHH